MLILGVNILDIDIGKKIKKLRKEQDMSIADLAEKSGISCGLISQIERNMGNPSISSLWSIAQSLGVPISYFFQENNAVQANPVVKKSNRKKILISNSNAIYELLSSDLNRKIEFLYITIKPEDCSTENLTAHEGEECGIVIEGKLMVETAEGNHILEEGDSIYFESTIPHRYVNIGDKVCISIWAITPASF